MQSSRGDSDGGVKRLKLRNTISNLGSLGAIIHRRRISRPALRVFFLQMLLFSVAYRFPAVLPAQLKPTGEYELKAAFLFNFAKFVDWPSNTFTEPQDPFSVCVLGTVINPDAADRAGLKISSKLLALAKIVRDTPAGRN
jgi:YfiR/HmsC-like